MLKVHNLKKSFGGVKAVDIDEIFFEQNQLTVSYAHLRAHET